MKKYFVLAAVALVSLSFGTSLAPYQDKENAEFKLAVNLFNDGMYDLAVEQFKNFIGAYPNTSQGIEARFYLGQTQMKLKRYDEAVTRYQESADLFGESGERDLQSLSIKAIANIRLKRGQLNQAGIDMIGSLGAAEHPTMAQRILKFLLRFLR